LLVVLKECFDPTAHDFALTSLFIPRWSLSACRSPLGLGHKGLLRNVGEAWYNKFEKWGYPPQLTLCTQVLRPLPSLSGKKGRAIVGEFWGWIFALYLVAAVVGGNANAASGGNKSKRDRPHR
jgi:hypothetical protein